MVQMSCLPCLLHPQGDVPFPFLALHAMPDGVLHKGLYHQGRHHYFLGIDVIGHLDGEVELLVHALAFELHVSA